MGQEFRHSSDETSAQAPSSCNQMLTILWFSVAAWDPLPSSFWILAEFSYLWLWDWVPQLLDSALFQCLENPRDGGAWWAAVYGVAQSRTRLKRLSSSSSSSNYIKRQKALINKIRDVKGEIIIDTTEIQRIIREYYEQLNTKLDKFLEDYFWKKWMSF